MNPIDAWHGLLQPEELTASAFAQLSARMRAERLTFGDRVHCPFLRPLFLTEDDERRVREFAETLAVLGERVVGAAMAEPALLDELGLRPDERRLIDIEPGYARASTSSRVDTFLLPGLPAGRGVQRRVAGRVRVYGAPGRRLRAAAGDGAVQGGVRRRGVLPHGDDARRPDDELSRLGRHGPAAAPSASWTGATCRHGASSKSSRSASPASACRRSCAPLRTSSSTGVSCAGWGGRSTCCTGACSSTTSRATRPSARRSSARARRRPSAWPTRSAARSRTRRRSSRC